MIRRISSAKDQDVVRRQISMHAHRLVCVQEVQPTADMQRHLEHMPTVGDLLPCLVRCATDGIDRIVQVESDRYKNW